MWIQVNGVNLRRNHQIPLITEYAYLIRSRITLNSCQTWGILCELSHVIDFNLETELSFLE